MSISYTNVVPLHTFEYLQKGNSRWRCCKTNTEAKQKHGEKNSWFGPLTCDSVHMLHPGVWLWAGTDEQMSSWRCCQRGEQFQVQPLTVSHTSESMTLSWLRFCVFMRVLRVECMQWRTAGHPFNPKQLIQVGVYSMKICSQHNFYSHGGWPPQHRGKLRLMTPLSRDVKVLGESQCLLSK